MSQVAILGSHGKRTDPEASEFVLGFVDAMKPQDAAETLLLTQMATVHQSKMMLARRLNHVETIQRQDAAEWAYNKLARTFQAQMDSLKRHRTKVQQMKTILPVYDQTCHSPGGQSANCDPVCHQSIGRRPRRTAKKSAEQTTNRASSAAPQRMTGGSVEH